MAAPPQARSAVAWPEFPAPGRPRRFLRGALLGAAAAAAVFALRFGGWAVGTAGVILAAVLVLLVPTSRELARRVLLAGTMMFGWVPVLWWVPLPVGVAGRATIGLALLAGGLAAWVGLAERPMRRARLLLPRLRVVDLLLPVLAGLAAVVYSPNLAPKTGRAAMGLLLSGWDNSAHFSMVHMIRGHGVTVDALPPPTGGTWQFAAYPQGYHAVVATMTELILGPERRDVGAELAAYTRSVALVVLVAVLMVVAGLCALPALRRRPAIAVPAGTFIATVYVLGPGSEAINGGFGNFIVAAALVVAVVLIVVPLARAWTLLHIAALGGAALGVATSWVLLLVVALPASLAAFVPLRRSRWRARWPQLAACLLILAAMTAGLARTALVLSHVQVTTNPLEITGGIVAPDLGMVVAGTLACLGMCVLAGRYGPRWTVVAATPLVGGAAAATLVALQIDAAGEITYYGFKFLAGLELVTLPLLAVAVAVVLAGLSRRARPGPAGRVATDTAPTSDAGPLDEAGGAALFGGPEGGRHLPVGGAVAFDSPKGGSRLSADSEVPSAVRSSGGRVRRSGRVRAAIASVTITVAVTQVFGLSAAEQSPPGPEATGKALPAAPGVTNRAHQLDLIDHPPATARLADAAVAVAQVAGSRTVVYLDVPPTPGVDPILAAQWLFSLTDTWTLESNALAGKIDLGDHSVFAVTAAARRILAERPDVLVAVPSPIADALRPELGEHLAERVLPIP